jgi:hypothetical protein
VTDAIKIDAVGIVCTLQPGGRYVGVTTAQGHSIAFAVTHDCGGYGVDITWRGVTVTGADDDLHGSFVEAKDLAASYVPKLYHELVALEWAAYVARREERQAREAEAEDEAANG